jgi:hypothetical protein
MAELDPPVPVRSRLTGHSGRLWRFADLANLKSTAVALTCDALTIELVGAVPSASRHEAAPMAGIEPAMGAWMIEQIGSAGAVRNMSTHMHPRVRRPSGGIRSRREIESRDG